MAKNIILLSDGTGNSNIKDRGTNVFKLYEAIDLNCSSPKQVAFYDDGVGTEKFKPIQIVGSAFGFGLAHNVKALYKHLAQIYTPRDKIFMFGFSRGAFTVRTLAGFISKEGILNINQYANDVTLDSAVSYLYENYRFQNTAFLEKVLKKLPLPRKKIQTPITYTNEELELEKNDNRLIEFIGVWDTVDAVGLPFDEATLFWNKFIFRFKFSNRILHSRVKKACHALAIDEERSSFHPLLWENDSRIEQVWFPGVHSNVGGGYPQQGLSLVALDWMMEKAATAGLKFIPTYRQFVRDQEYAFDKLYDSRSGLGMYYRYKPRNIAEICSANKITTPKIHMSAFQRIAAGIFGYAPGNFPTNFEMVDNSGTHASATQISQILNQRLVVAKIIPPTNNTSPLLAKMKWHICFRKTIYYLFLLYSLWILRLLIKDYINHGAGFLSAIKKLITFDSQPEMLVSLFFRRPLLLILGIFIVYFGLHGRKKMSIFFSEFWSPLRSKIKAWVP
ncbi:MAG: DUF2235 domain-containing protein [Nitrospirae bacterium]|nr:DUF2235 domain-containing protein [Candidatus Troglogloeales bacterium]